MSNTKKTVTLTENQLVATIEKIVEEAVAQKKSEWLAEQKKGETDMLEETITKIVAKQLSKK